MTSLESPESISSFAWNIYSYFHIIPQHVSWRLCSLLTIIWFEFTTDNNTQPLIMSLPWASPERRLSSTGACCWTLFHYSNSVMSIVRPSPSFSPYGTLILQKNILILKVSGSHRLSLCILKAAQLAMHLSTSAHSTVKNRNGDTWMLTCSGCKLFNSEWLIPKWQGQA